MKYIIITTGQVTTITRVAGVIEPVGGGGWKERTAAVAMVAALSQPLSLDGNEFTLLC